MSSDIVLSHRRHPICHTIYHQHTDVRVTTDDSNVLHTPSQQSNSRSLVRNVQGVHQRLRSSVAVGHSHVVVVGNNDNIHSSSAVDVKDSCWALLEGRVGRGAGGEVLLLLGELEEEEEEGINNSSHSKEEETNSSHSEEEGINSSHSRSSTAQRFKEPTRKTGDGQKILYGIFKIIFMLRALSCFV
jgi:hypothetical protein